MEEAARNRRPALNSINKHNPIPTMRTHTLAYNPGHTAALKSIPFLGAISVLLLIAFGSELRANEEAPAPKAATTKLVPPVTVQGSQITGKGSKRKGKITIENAAERGITRIELAQLFLGADGAVVDNRSSELTFRLPPLRPGKSTTTDADGPFWAGGDDSDSIVEVVGVIQIIEFEDGSSWPPLRAQAPDVDGDAPVGLAMIGVVGEPPLALPEIHCHNHGEKAVERVGYFIEFLDGDGKRLSSTNMIASVSGDDGGLKSRTGTILAPSFTVPEGTKRAKLRCTNVIFADGTVWHAPEFR